MENTGSSESEDGRSGDDIESEVDVYPIEEAVESTDDEKAWGINKADFYHGDVHSSDDLEKEEVDLTQLRIYANFHENDFQSPWLNSFKPRKASLQLTQMVHDVSPDIKTVISSLSDGVAWIDAYGLRLVKKFSYISPESRLYLQTKLHFHFCYCLNILFYLWLHTKRFAGICDHPVLKQMLFFSQFLENVGGRDDLIKKLSSPADASDLRVDSTVKKEQLNNLKRSITFQMARNKGIVPKRKKEQRNPRVKHRNKYRKALIKQRSQHLSVVQELEKYGGELSGIRSKVTRSIQIK